MSQIEITELDVWMQCVWRWYKQGFDDCSNDVHNEKEIYNLLHRVAYDLGQSDWKEGDGVSSIDERYEVETIAIILEMAANELRNLY